MSSFLFLAASNSPELASILCSQRKIDCLATSLSLMTLRQILKLRKCSQNWRMRVLSVLREMNKIGVMCTAVTGAPRLTAIETSFYSTLTLKLMEIGLIGCTAAPHRPPTLRQSRRFLTTERSQITLQLEQIGVRTILLLQQTWMRLLLR